MIVAPGAEMPPQKNHPKDIYVTRTAFMEYYQSTLHWMLHLEQEHVFRWLDIEFLKS